MPAHDHSHHDRSAQPEGSFWTSRAFLVCAGLPGHRPHPAVDRAPRARSWLPALPSHSGVPAHAHVHARGHGGHGGGHAHHSRTDRERDHRMEASHERGGAGLRLVGPGPHQLGDLHLLRLHVLQAEDLARLAQLRRVQRLPGCAVHGDVRLPADALLPVRVAADPISQRGLALPRRRPSAGDAVRLEGQSRTSGRSTS